MKHYIYLIQEIPRGKGRKLPVKIGRAKNVDKRLEAMQTGNSNQLEIVAKLGPFNHIQAQLFEKSLHRRFAKYHVRGEWFWPECIQQISRYEEICT